MNEVSSSVSLFPSLSLTLTGGPVGLTAKLAPGNTYDEQIERLKQIKKSWVMEQGCFFFWGGGVFLLKWVKALICCHVSSIQVSRKLRLRFFLIPVCAPCAIISLSHQCLTFSSSFCFVYHLDQIWTGTISPLIP